MSGLRQRSLEPVLRRSGLLIAMYGTAAVIALWMSRTLPDFDYGFHLRTGQWIVAHGSVPDAEVFSANAVSPRWVAYSWAYEVLLCALAAAFGVWAPVVLSVAMSLLIAHMIFKMVRRTSGHTALAAGLTLIGILAMASMLYGRSVMFTIVFAALELHLLLRATVLANTSGTSRSALRSGPTCTSNSSTASSCTAASSRRRGSTCCEAAPTRTRRRERTASRRG